MRRAGAIVLGKTNSPIMGFRGTCDNYLFDVPRVTWSRLVGLMPLRMG